MKILIVDDEPINILLLESLFKNKFETDTAENGLEAYNKIVESPPDIVLLDVLMPYMDGFETLEKIKTNKNIANTIVIMVTAKVEKDDVKKAMLLGADDYIKKPIDATELYTKIDIHARLKESEKQVNEYQVYANIHESMISAQRIQQSLLPDKQNFLKIFKNSFILYKPRDMIGGDLYFISQKLNKKFICVSDATGHGVPAAMISILAYMSLDWVVNKENITNPLKVAKELRKELQIHLGQSADTYAAKNGLDAVFCEYDELKQTLNFVGAGRPLIIVRKGKNHIIINGQQVNSLLHINDQYLFYLRGDFVTLDIEETTNVLSNHEIKIDKDDTIYLFSDGITDQFGGKEEKKFSKKRLLNILLRNQTKSLKSQKLLIYKELDKWSLNQEQTDDIVIIGIQLY
ncbi:MAG: response regulator [Bacteroidales bacterium]|nr:response regulator [Bacteroidales bacterium]MBN2757812.1 response regulator [Bacteroidales bacterium]